MENKILYSCGLVICLIVTSGILVHINGEQFQIPAWVKNIARWWHEGAIDDSEFVKGIQYLIENKIMVIHASNMKIVKENKIPFWVKNNAGWWANGVISDNDFVSSIQYLINSGVMVINSDLNSTGNNPETQCDRFTTPAEKETCMKQIEYDAKIKSAIEEATKYAIGPVTFYYVNSESQTADDGKMLLTIHLVVENTGNQEITMTCLRQDSCNYALSDGQKEIPYATNTLVYGSLTLPAKTTKLVDWTFYGIFDTSKGYSFLIKEPWGTGSIPIKIH